MGDRRCIAVLVARDRDTRLAVATRLADAGLLIHVSDSLPRALQLAERHGPDVLIVSVGCWPTDDAQQLVELALVSARVPLTIVLWPGDGSTPLAEPPGMAGVLAVNEAHLVAAVVARLGIDPSTGRRP